MTAVTAANGDAGARVAIDDLLLGLNRLGLDWRASETSPDGPWRAQCPCCREFTGDDELPLTLTRAGHARCSHSCDADKITAKILGAATNGHAAQASVVDATIVTLGEFIAVDEPGAAPLLGDEGGALIPEGGDMMVYGDGGAGKTTLLFDLAFHLAAGEDWLGIPVGRPVRVLLIENEGPRPLLRQKLRRKFEAWNGTDPSGRISVFEKPWAEFTFAREAWREQLAVCVAELEVDVIIAGPLTRIGMDAAGTLQETAAFMALVADARRRSGRMLTVIIAHHQNRAGTVSGAWEGAGDTLLHVQAAGNGHTVVFIQKARWASSYHHTTLKLAWTDGEGFDLEGDRDYVAEIRELLSDGGWRTAKEIAAPGDAGERPGIGASEKTVREVLAQHPETFEARSGDAAKALGRSARSTLYALSSGLNSLDSVGEFQGGAEGHCVTASPLKGRSASNTPPSSASGTESDPELSAPPVPWTEDELRGDRT